MSEQNVEVRLATSGDRSAILAVHRNAFGEAEGPVIAALVDEMLDDVSGAPMLSLLAQIEEQVVAHVLFTTVRFEPAQEPIHARILAPMSVRQNQQRQNIGGMLIQTGFDLLKASGVHLVFVLGYPDYYSRFGFQPAGIQGIQATYPIPPQHADAWMVSELVPGMIEKCNGTVRCANALDHPKYWGE